MSDPHALIIAGQELTPPPGLEVGLPPCAAYEQAVVLATGAHSSIDVSDLLGSGPIT